MPSQRVERETPTFIQAARRQQLVDVAIEVIAELGAERASLSKVADRAGVSRGVIGYHFGSRDDLLDAVIAEVYAVGAREVGPAVAEAASPPDSLSAFVSGSIDFYAKFPHHMQALTAVFASGHRPRVDRGEHAAELLELDSILQRGIDAAQFRPMETAVVASIIRAILDVAVKEIAAGRDSRSIADEVLYTVLAATRRENT